MGEVSGDSSSPLLQIPSPISQTQRAELYCQAPAQPCYLSLSHTHTQIHEDKHTKQTLSPLQSVDFDCLFVLLSFCFSVSRIHKHPKTVHRLLSFFFFVCLHPWLTQTHNAKYFGSEAHNLAGGVSLFSLSASLSLYFTYIHTEELNKSFTSLLHLWCTPTTCQSASFQ